MDQSSLGEPATKGEFNKLLPLLMRFIMVFITSKSGLAMAKKLIREAKNFDSFIIGDKMVTRAIKNNDPLILLVAADDGSCGDHVAKATELNIPIIIMSTRLEVGELIGVQAAVVCCAVTFMGHEELIAEIVRLG